MKSSFCCLLILLLCASTAFAAQPRDVVLVLDNSGSMKRNDPARLTVDAVKAFIGRQQPGTRLGLILFADSPRLVAPLMPVNDQTRTTLLAGLEQLNYSGRWTETAEALERAIYELRVNGREQALQAIVLMSDGVLDTGNAERDQMRMDWLRNSLVQDAQQQGIIIFGLAFTENADFQLLQLLAQATGGEYFRAVSAQGVESVLARIDNALNQRAQSAALATTVPASQPGSQTPSRQVPAEQTASPSRDQSTATLTGTSAQQNQPVSSGAQSSPNRIVFTGQAAAQMQQSVERNGVVQNKHLVLWVLLAALVLLFIVAGAGWWAIRYWNLPALLRGKPLAANQDQGPKAVLYDVHDPSDIKRHEMAERPMVIGRVGGNDQTMDYIVVEERTIGRWHATIERRGQSFWIRDEGSINGTYVNENRVTTEHPLKHGDVLRVHKHEFEFVIPELFDSDRTLMADERTKARAIQTARPTTTARPTQTARG